MIMPSGLGGRVDLVAWATSVRFQGVVKWSATLRREQILVLIAISFASTSCAQLNPRPEPIRAMEPRPNPPSSRAATIQQAPDKNADLQEQLRRDRWVTLFWSELTSDQRQRIARRMQHAAPSLAGDRDGQARYWDVMGLEDRLKLVRGKGSVPVLSTTLPSESPDMLDMSAKENRRPTTGVGSRAEASKTDPAARP